MAFIEGTPIFTDSGWKPIEEIAGHDRVLVRNFIGEAEFIQPFAVKKKKYNGKITKLGGKYWNITTTPDHIIAYDRDDKVRGRNFLYKKAKDVVCNPDNRIYRKFKYITPNDYKKENIVIYNQFGKSWITISNQDWFVLCAFVLLRGYLEPAGRRRSLNIYLNREKRADELVLLADILGRIGVTWTLIESKTDDRWLVRISPHNTLASKLSKRLGSLKRKKMYIPDIMIYNSSKELTNVFIKTLIDLSKKPDTVVRDTYQFTNNNKRLIDTIALMGTLSGYSMTTKLQIPKGTDQGRGALSKDIYRLFITNLSDSYSPTKKSEEDYKGYVYEMYLFDGQIYVKESTAPIWVNPK